MQWALCLFVCFFPLALFAFHFYLCVLAFSRTGTVKGRNQENWLYGWATPKPRVKIRIASKSARSPNGLSGATATTPIASPRLRSSEQRFAFVCKKYTGSAPWYYAHPLPSYPTFTLSLSPHHHPRTPSSCPHAQKQEPGNRWERKREQAMSILVVYGNFNETEETGSNVCLCTPQYVAMQLTRTDKKMFWIMFLQIDSP